MTQRPKIPALIERFSRNIDAYRAGRYNETQVRHDFIDPLFEALGWDINNRAGYAEAYRDVIHEDAIKVGGVIKAPDYCFRIGGTRKFFVEAKKPSVNIAHDVHPAYQLRRYAWSAKLPLSILTDFEELAVYDCRVRPNPRDKTGVARTMYFTYEHYADKWDEIASVFSKEAILQGSFDKYVTGRKKRGTAEVDAEFLKEIEKWRGSLASNIAQRNMRLSVREINFAVQRIIDRIIFLRMAEDRGVEEYATLQALINGNDVYGRLMQIFRAADDRYNSGLFHFNDEPGRDHPPDTLTPEIKVDDKVLKSIFKGLYYPESPYEFSVLPADILGNVYEQFLGKVIRLTKGHQARVDKKPEVKKAGGVYYTPNYIVDYIVKHTVGRLITGEAGDSPGSQEPVAGIRESLSPKGASDLSRGCQPPEPESQKSPAPKGRKKAPLTPQEIGGLTEKYRPSKARAPLRILDPACGSGSFLVGAYKFLLDYHRDWYVNDGPEKHTKQIYQGAGGQWYLSTAEKKRILLSNIYGVDIDSQAVEVTKLNLLLCVLENENQGTVGQMALIHERVLPDLGDNIKCGNSLIGPDFYEGKQLALFDEEARYRINAFDWPAEFPDMFDPRLPAGRQGFDAVIGNPPYDVLEKERKKSSWPHASLRTYIDRRSDYVAALGGKLNLFRFFVVQCANLTRTQGKFSMIVPLALLGDKSCAATRRFLISNSSFFSADCFPQKDNPNRRVFRNAKLSTMVFCSERIKKTDERNASVQMRVFPWNSFEDPCRASHIQLADAALLDPVNIPIPLVDADQWEVCVRLHRHPSVRRIGDMNDFTVTRGEINQTIYRKFITGDRSQARLLKGVEVGRYVLRKRLSQGQREWFDEAAFLRAHQAKPCVTQHRIATQRITGVDERLRIVATIITPTTYFADSTNSVCIDPA